MASSHLQDSERESVAELLIRALVYSHPGHDGPAPGPWFCGECPYMNVGALCTKCGAPAGAGRFYEHPKETKT